jgi:hypothetical protein
MVKPDIIFDLADGFELLQNFFIESNIKFEREDYFLNNLPVFNLIFSPVLTI